MICRLPADPTFEEVESLGAVVEKHAEGHTVAGGTVWVSGEIPRVTGYEGGILGGVRWVTQGADKDGKWVPDEVGYPSTYETSESNVLIWFFQKAHHG